MASLVTQPVFITGLPRSGTSLTAGALAGLGVFTGPTVPGGEPNPKGFFENVDIREGIVKGILRVGGFCPLGVRLLPPKNFDKDFMFDSSKTLKNILLDILAAQGYKADTPWLYKDAKLTLLWRIFHRQFPDALWVITSRARENFVRSCLRTSFMVQHSDNPQFWDDFADQYESRLCDLVESVDRAVVINTDDLVAGNHTPLQNVCKELGLEYSAKVVNDFVIAEHWNR